MTLPDAPATGRNRDPILDVLQVEFSESRDILEIGSGTGQHAVYFASVMPHLNWQTSDRDENHAAIATWLDHASLQNVAPPLSLDVLADPIMTQQYDGVFSANTAHIMSMNAVVAMFALVGTCLKENGRFCLYGPFNIDNEFTSDSNARFDATLRGQDASMGIRDLAQIDDLAVRNGMRRTALYAMPANNFLVTWQRD